MATIKSYSDLQQSKKLADILPLESADMFLAMNGILPVMSKYIDDGLVTADETAIPCWSLATLFNIIPQELFGGEYIINITEGLDYKWIISYEYHFEGSSYIDVSGDSLIDCCVDMIIKLKERNLL